LTYLPADIRRGHDFTFLNNMEHNVVMKANDD
jgi:hypothetical protein